MALSNAEKERRRNDPHIKDITERICRYDSGKPYVFISYKSDDWERVLGDIVHKLVMDFGLNVYFDGDFNGHNPIWTQQFPENMEADNCKGVIAFVDDAYTTSYATLMELLYSRVGCQEKEPPYNTVKKPVVTINLGKLTIIHDKSDTGLGVQYYEDGEANVHWQDEKDLFDDLFKKAEKSEIISNTVKPYKKEKKLSKELCSAMFKEVIASIHVNDNYLDAGITLEDIVHTIESEFGKDVFGKIDSGLDDKSENEIKSIKGGENDRKTSDKEDESGKVSYRGRDIPPEKTALDTIKIISDGSIFHKRGKDGSYDAFYRKDGDKYVVLAGSKLRYNEKWTPKKIWEQYKEKITNEGILLCDINNLPISTAAKLIEGASTSGKELDTNDFLLAEGESYEVSYDSSKTAADTGIIINPEKDDPEDVSEFKLNGEPLEGGRKSSRSVVSNPIIKKTNGFEYTLWGISHTSNKMSDMMHDVFDLIAEKYPGKISELANSDAISSVARKDDVDGGNLPAGKLNYFRASREHNVNGIAYYVGTSYNRSQGIGQIERMLKICEGSADSFVITSSPERISHSGGNTGKKGLDELL